jgi:hypothetical protein
MKGSNPVAQKYAAALSSYLEPILARRCFESENKLEKIFRIAASGVAGNNHTGNRQSE